MKTDLPFHELEESSELVEVTFDGEKYLLPRGANLAAAMLSVGIRVFRNNPASGAPRAPYCMMGACFECLVSIDGIQRQSCMLRVEPGLKIVRAHTAEAFDAFS